jgi:hypothetical protein
LSSRWWSPASWWCTAWSGEVSKNIMSYIVLQIAFQTLRSKDVVSSHARIVTYCKGGNKGIWCFVVLQSWHVDLFV